MRFLAVVAALAAGAVLAETEVHATAETGVQSTYVFRGVPMYRTAYAPSSQSTLGVALDGVGPGTLSFSLWNATALVDHTAHGGNQLEFDVALLYAWKLGGFELAAGYTGYLYPEAAVVDQAHELNLSAAWPARYATPFLSLNLEGVRLRGAYVQAGAVREFVRGAWTLTPKLALAGLGYAEVAPTLSDASASLTLKWQFAKHGYALASLSAAERLNRPGASPLEASVVWGGLSLGLTP